MEQTDKTRSALFAAVVTTVVVLALSLLVGGLPTWLWAVILILADGMAVLIARGVVDRREQALLRKIMEQQRGQIEETVVDPEPDEPTHVQAGDHTYRDSHAGKPTLGTVGQVSTGVVTAVSRSGEYT
ncbi:hypothetical protein ACFQ1S_26605, partial [Kibdelosporangium lantanae]